MKDITRETIPCWYELSWRGGSGRTPAIVLRVHEEFIEGTQLVQPDAPIVKALRDNFHFKTFEGSFDGNFGFDNAFRRSGEDGPFVEFLVELPAVRREIGEKCDRCRGSRRERDSRQPCLKCEGSGKRIIYDYSRAYATSASFTLFGAVSYYPEIGTSLSLPQLFTVRTTTEKDLHCGSLWGEFSVPLCKWLSFLEQLGGREIPEVVDTMMQAYGRMIGMGGYERFHFCARTESKGFFVADCPGNACGIHPWDMNLEAEIGYKFESHNVDTPVQQLTLLAGLAALHDKARKEIGN